MSSGFAHINNGKIADIFYPPAEDVKMFGKGMYKSMVRLSPEAATPDNYMDVIKKIHDAAPNPLPNRDSPYESPDISMKYANYGNGDKHQIETNLEPQELLGALASSGLITQEEMIGAYKELGLSPQNRVIGKGLRPMDTPNHPPPNLPSFSLF
jgi:hypothetical protein